MPFFYLVLSFLANAHREKEKEDKRPQFDQGTTVVIKINKGHWEASEWKNVRIN